MFKMGKKEDEQMIRKLRAQNKKLTQDLINLKSKHSQVQKKLEAKLLDSTKRIKKILDEITAQCLASIEKDRVDTLVFSVEPIEALEDEIVRRVVEAGYDEIPVISGFSAAMELAQVMVNMKITQAPRAYPDASLKAKPEYW